MDAIGTHAISPAYHCRWLRIPPPAGKQPDTYQITVTGTSSGTAADAGQSAVVTLVVDWNVAR
jgi:hypothetical protein